MSAEFCLHSGSLFGEMSKSSNLKEQINGQLANQQNLASIQQAPKTESISQPPLYV